MKVAVNSLRSAIALAVAILCVPTGSANAVSWRTRFACASDYYAYCSAYTAGTPEGRKCMRANGSRLSKGCISALIADGYISQAEVAKHKDKIAAAKAARKVPDDPKAKDASKAADVLKSKAEPKPAAVAEQTKAKSTTTKIVTAALIPPKPKLIRVGELPSAAKPAPRVSIDMATYDALKNREARFVATNESETAAAVSDASTMAWPPAVVHAAVSVDVPTVKPRQPTRTAEADQGSDQKSANAETAVSYPDGRMSLGRRSVMQDAEGQKPGFWTSLIQALSGHGKER